MRGTNLGELEEIVLLTVASLYDEAYGISIQAGIKSKCNRSISISTVHNVLTRLAEKGYLVSRYDGATEERGGRRKHLFRVTKAGQGALVIIKSIRDDLWGGITDIAFEP